MISHQDNCLFVHIPKAAGQSIESVFVERAGLTWQKRAPLLLRPNTDSSKGPPRLAHLTAQEYVDLGYVTQREYQNLFKFSFVRNPWARLVSEYNYRRSHGDIDYQQGFKYFLFNRFPKPSSDNYLTGKDHYRHIMPQVEFLYDGNGNCLVDFIGKFENLQADFNQVCAALSLEPITLAHTNKTLNRRFHRRLLVRLLNSLSINIKQLNKESSAHYSSYYDDETKAFVAQKYAKDIKVFNYKFELKAL